LKTKWAQKVKHVRKAYIYYSCSNCDSIVGFADIVCPATGCGVRFLKDVRNDKNEAEAEAKA